MLTTISPNPGTSWLQLGGWLSVGAALLHMGCILGGPKWYRFFGAGEDMARAAARGEWTPALITLAIASILLVWAAYAFSGAGSLPRLRLLRPGLVAITAIYLLRGLLFVPVNLVRHSHSAEFALWSSAIVLVLGAVHAAGTIKAWGYLAP